MLYAQFWPVNSDHKQTNDSSIVSKGSVERLYFPNETHFFHHFVKKPQRRSPLINRGYWLRMKAVDHVVRQFLEKSPGKKKALINLGCGYDPLPWQCLQRYPSASKDVVFIDIDYVALLEKKRKAVLTMTQLNSMLTDIEVPEAGDILFRSKEYLQIGCDLRDLVGLQRSLASTIDLEHTSILFVAEVSIAYMDIQSADALIKWAGRVPDSSFCLLEQILPNGTSHPFAKTMMDYFSSIQTPLRPAERYSSASHQQARFEDLGWSDVVARNLWELWGSADFLTPTERKNLDLVEPFDEWEEFALFGCHYVLLIADNLSSRDASPASSTRRATKPIKNLPHAGESLKAEISYAEYPKGQGFKRFASALPIRGLQPIHKTFGNFGGVGLVTRENSMDVYGNDGNLPYVFDNSANTPTPPSRMCHTSTDLGDCGTLLIGGRTSPDRGFSDCWLYHKSSGLWEQVQDLPNPRYRHQAVYLGNGYVLVSPGKSNSRVFGTEYLVWHRQTGWLNCDLGGSSSPPVSYGSVFSMNALDSKHDISTPRTGLFAGGVTEYGAVEESSWHWELVGLAAGVGSPISLCRHIARFMIEVNSGSVQMF